MSALGAYLTQKPVKIRLNRYNDIRLQEKRHDFKIYYTVGFTVTGKILALDINF